MQSQIKEYKYSWIYNKYNDNIYVLLVIIISLVLFIINVDYYKKKQDYNPNVPRTNILTNIINEL
jgi:hypothetical protein